MVTDNLISAPYGTWKSPITAEAISKNANAIEEILVDAITSKIYHLERRPSEGGRSVLVDTAAGRDLVPRSFNVRTGVQEYGGSAALVHNGVAWFSNYEDGRIYKVRVKEGEEEEPVVISPADRPYRYANITFHPTHPELLVAVLEDHTVDEASSVVTSICVIDTHSKTIVNQNLVSNGTADSFYALPRFTPDGKKLAWMYWTHPDMPWQGAEIHIADVEFTNSSGSPSLRVTNVKKISGEKGKVSACYLLFASNSTLLFTNDETGWVAPWKYDFGSSGEAVAKPLLSLERDFGEPMWSLGNQFPYTVVNGGREAIWVACKEGRHVLHHIEIATGNSKEIASPYVEVICPSTVQGKEGEAIVFGGVKVDEKKTIVRVSISSLLSGSPDFETNILPPPTEASTTVLSKNLVSIPQPIALELPNNEGPLHIVFYPPSNPQYSGSSVEGEKPPCVISVHGGPTGHEPQGLNWRKQYFTTRGWAWVDVNYRGSSAYGRDYIARLDGDWGVVDVQDCISTVHLLSSPPYSLVDGKRCTIRGGSAGGYTTLAALSLPKSVDERKVFAAAQSSYGVSDLKKLEEFTHKFESRYLEALLIGKQGEGKWNNAEERVEVLEKINKERSPIFWIDNIEVPLLILQGEIDKVVPKEQAELMYEKLKAKGGIVEYKLYPGEGHGWRQEVHLKDSLEREIGFYEKVLGLDVQN